MPLAQSRQEVSTGKYLVWITISLNGFVSPQNLQVNVISDASAFTGVSLTAFSLAMFSLPLYVTSVVFFAGLVTSAISFFAFSFPDSPEGKVEELAL